MDLVDVIVAVAIGGLVVASYLKGNVLFSVAAGLGALVAIDGQPALGLFVAVPAAIVAFRLAKPDSIWATTFYRSSQRQEAHKRYGQSAEPRQKAPWSADPPPAATGTGGPAAESTDDSVARERIAAFLTAALDRDLIDHPAYSRLRTLLDERYPKPRAPERLRAPTQPAPAARPPQPAPPIGPPQPSPPADDKVPPAKAPPPKAPPTPAPPTKAPPSKAVSGVRLPAASIPAPPEPAEPPPAWEPAAIARRRATELWEAIGPDISVHGFTYLGLLLTFVGVFGFMFFSFADLPDEVQPFIEVLIPLIFFGWAWFLKKRDAVVVGDIMEFLGGLVLPLVVFAGLVDNAPVPPDLTGGWLIAGLFTVCLLIAAGYAWWSARHPNSMLRYLVAPMIWVAAMAPGFVFKTDEALVSVAITRLVSAQPALAAAAITATMAWAELRPTHRLAAPTAAAAVPGVPLTYLLTLVLAAGEGWAYPAPLLIAGAATLGSSELLARRYELTSVMALLRPFLLAVTLIPLVPVVGLGWVGLIAVVAYLALVEWEIQGDAEPVALMLAGAGAVVGLGMTMTEPWLMVAGWATASVWAHWRRIEEIESHDVRQVLVIAASVLPAGVAVGLVRALPDESAGLLIGVGLVALTVAVRWKATSDPFWKYWLTGAGAVLAAGILDGYVDGTLESLWPAAAAAILAAVTLGAAPGWPAARVWMAGGAAGLAMWIGLDAANASSGTETVVWAGAGLAAVAVAWVWARPPAAHLAVLGHLVGFGALLAGGSAETRAFTVSAWTLGWIVAVASDATERDHDSIVDLIHGGATRAGVAGQRWERAVNAVPSVVLALSIPYAALALVGLWDEFGDTRAWTGIVLALLAIAYGVSARLLGERQPHGVVFAVGAVVLSVIAAAIAAPDSWPSIVAAASVVAVGWLVAGPLGWTLFTWFAWAMLGVLTVLLAYEAGVPARHLHFVVLVWGAVLLIGGLAIDDVRAGRRQRGVGLRVSWVQYPVVLGALAIPLGLAPMYTQSPDVFGWWSLLAAAGYAAVAVQLRAGVVTAPAYALAAVGVVALAPFAFMEQPWVLWPIAAALVAVSWAAERLQGQTSSAERYQRWDLPPLIIAHIVAVVGLVRAAEVDSVPTWVGFGALSVLVGIWRKHRAWTDVGNILVLVGAALAGPGWLALALSATSVRGVIGAATTTDFERWSYHAMGLVAAGAGWVALGVWQDWSRPEVLSYTALAFGALGLVVGGVAVWRRVADDWVAVWGGLAVTGVVVSAVVSPGNVVDVLPAIGMLLFALGSGLTARRYQHSAMQALTVAAVAMAWVEVVWWRDWSTSDIVAFTSLAAGVVALVVSLLLRFGRLSVSWTLAWGGLALTGLVVAGALVPETNIGIAPVVGTLLFAGAAALAARRIADLGMMALTVAAAGWAWVEIVFWQAWSTPEIVSYTALAFGALGAVVGGLTAWRRLAMGWVIAWGGLAMAGIVTSVALAPGNVADPAPAIGMLLFATGSFLAHRRIDHPALQALTVGAVGVAWVEIVFWQGWSTPEIVSHTALLFGGLGAVVGALIAWRGLAMGWVGAWGGLALAGIVLSIALAPGNVVDAAPAVGALLFGAGAALAHRRIDHPALRALTVGAVGVAWVETVLWRDWSTPEIVSYTALAFGALGALVGGLTAWRGLTSGWAVGWGGLAFIGIAASVALAPGNLVDLYPAIGTSLFAVGAGLAHRQIEHPAMQALTVTAVGVAWAELIGGAGWGFDQASSYTSLAVGTIAVAAAVLLRIGRLSPSWAIAWGGLATTGTVIAWLATLSADTQSIAGPAPAAGLALLAVATTLAARPLSYSLHYASIGLTGWAWVALAVGLDWTEQTTAVATAAVFGALGVVVSEVARSPWGAEIRAAAEGAAAETARAWLGLGGVGVIAAAGLAATLDERMPAWLAVALGLALLALAFARGAAPLGWPPLRELSALTALAAATVLGLAVEARVEALATIAILIGVVATLASLWLWTKRPSSDWMRPLLLVGIAATAEAFAFAAVTLPRRDVLALVLLGAAAQVVAYGLIRSQPLMVSLGPPIVLAAWIGVAAEAVQGTALWYTVPVALALIAEVDVARWSRRRAEQPATTPELLALEYAAIGLLGAVVLVEMFASNVAFSLLGFLISGGLLLWAAASKVRRRAVAAGVLATVTAVLTIFAAAAAQAPTSAFFWIVAAGTGFAVMLAMALIEAYRSKTGSVMLRIDELMEGWE